MDNLLVNSLDWLKQHTQPLLVYDLGHGHGVVISNKGDVTNLKPVREFAPGYATTTTTLEGFISALTAAMEMHKSRPLIRVTQTGIEARVAPHLLYGEGGLVTLGTYRDDIQKATREYPIEAFFDMLDSFTGKIHPADVGNAECSEDEFRTLIDMLDFQSETTKTTVKNQGAYVSVTTKAQGASVANGDDTLRLPKFIYLDIPYVAADVKPSTVLEKIGEGDKDAPHRKGIRTKLKINPEKGLFQLQWCDEDYLTHLQNFIAAELRARFADTAVVVTG